MREGITLTLREAGHAGPLREVLAEQTVEVLVTAALPSVVRRREIHKDASGGFKGPVVMKLCAVVGRERLEVVRGARDNPFASERGFPSTQYKLGRIQRKTMEEIQIIAPSGEWPRIRDDPRFIELMRLARVANSLALAYGPLQSCAEDQSVRARRERFCGLFYAAALLKEGLHTAQGLGQWFRDLPQYKDGFAVILSDPMVQSLQSGILDKIRDQLVFHFDRDAIAMGLTRLPLGDVVIGTFPPSGPTFGDTYFDVADDAVLGYLFGDAPSDEAYLEQLGTFIASTGDLFRRYLVAAHRLVAAGLMELGCRKRRTLRPSPSSGTEPGR